MDGLVEDVVGESGGAVPAEGFGGELEGTPA